MASPSNATMAHPCASRALAWALSLTLLAGCSPPHRGRRPTAGSAPRQRSIESTNDVLAWVIPGLLDGGGQIKPLEIAQTTFALAVRAVHLPGPAYVNPLTVSWLVVASGKFVPHTLGGPVPDTPVSGTEWIIVTKDGDGGTMSGGVPAGATIDLRGLGTVVHVNPQQWASLASGT